MKISREPNFIDDFQSVFDDNHDELMNYLKQSSTEQTKTFIVAILTLIATCISVLIAIAALIVSIVK